MIDVEENVSCDQAVEWGIALIDEAVLPNYQIDLLNRHRSGCSDCDALIGAAIEDAQLLSRFTWDGDEGGYEEDDEEYDQSLDGDDWSESDDYDMSEDPDYDDDEDEEEDDGDEAESAPGSEPGAGSGGRGQGQPGPSMQDDDSDDEEEAEQEAERRLAARASDEDPDADEEEEEEQKAATFSDEERDEMSDEAEAEADAMSDEDLSDLDDTPDGPQAEACLSEAVNNETPVSDADRKQAQEVVLADQDNVKTEFGSVQVLNWNEGLASRPVMSIPSASSAAATIRAAIIRSRGGHSEVSHGHNRGKLDGSALHKIARLDTHLFERKSAPSPRKMLVWVMVDCSGSMGGTPMRDAATVAKALAEASTGAPSVRLEVMGWSSPFTNDYYKTRTRQGYERASNTVMWSQANAGVCRLWRTGQPTNRIQNLTKLLMGGTPDSAVMGWAVEAMRREIRADETGMIIFCSDGAGDGDMPRAVEHGRKLGVLVKSVAIGDYVSKDWQEKVFGPGNYVEWRGSIMATAKPIASMILKEVRG